MINTSTTAVALTSLKSKDVCHVTTDPCPFLIYLLLGETLAAHLTPRWQRSGEFCVSWQSWPSLGGRWYTNNSPSKGFEAYHPSLRVSFAVYQFHAILTHWFSTEPILCQSFSLFSIPKNNPLWAIRFILTPGKWRSCQIKTGQTC